MSKERELLKKILATGWLNNTISCEVEELLAQPETEQITFKDDADKIAHLEKSVELLAGLLEDKKYVPLSDEDALKLFEEAEYLWFLEYKIGELKMQKQEHGIGGK